MMALPVSRWKRARQRQRGGLAGLGVRQHLGAVHAIERQGRTVDVLGAESSLAVRRVDTALRQPERGAGRQVVDDDDAGRAALDADRGTSVELAPDPAAMIGTRDARRRRHEQRRPFAGRTPFVVGRREVIEKRIGIRRIRIGRGLEDENLSRDLAGGRRMGGIVIQHRRGDALGRRRAGGHAVGGHDRHRRPVGDELLHRHAGIVDVGAPIRPIVHDVMVVGDLDDPDRRRQAPAILAIRKSV